MHTQKRTTRLVWKNNYKNEGKHSDVYNYFTTSCYVVLYCLCLLVFGNAMVVGVSHPEEAIFVTANSHTIIKLARECVNKVVVWTEDPETIAATTLTDGNVYSLDHQWQYLQES